MNKAFQFILFAILFIAIKSDFDMCEEGNTSSADADYCRIRSTNQNHTHCCYIESTTKTGCKELTDDEYENIKRYVKFLKNSNDKVKIKCSGEFKSLTLFSLLSLFVLLF